ncbi:lactoperoxidase-like, partial [Penaeus japonicus]|uniref:lactoperoxidase-like n=1 Tax=Penaeus japonicus TaxID=27405 RepID=UPI001C70F1F6
MRKTIWVYFAMLLAIALGSEIPVAGPSEGKNGIWFMTKWEDSSAVARDELSRIFRDSRDVKVRRSFSRSLKMRVEKKSMRYGKTKLLEKDKIEGEIAAMTKAHASPSNGLDNLFTSNQTRFNKLSREGYVIDYATEYLKNRFKLSKTAVVSIKSKLLPKEDFCDKTGVSSLCPAYMHYRSSNGICNNLEKPFWGSTFRPFRRAAPSDYGDGFLSLRLAKDGQPLPSVRLVSSIIKDIQPKKQSSLPSVLHMAYGQFLGHDLIFAPLNKGSQESS